MDTDTLNQYWPIVSKTLEISQISFLVGYIFMAIILRIKLIKHISSIGYRKELIILPMVFYTVFITDAITTLFALRHFETKVIEDPNLVYFLISKTIFQATALLIFIVYDKKIINIVTKVK